jgi:beta-lactamase regulating signal transducer with metallopeptidase domain
MSPESPLVAAIWSWIVTASVAAAVLMPAGWLACRAFSRGAPAVRHQVWLYVMLAFVLLPLVRLGGPQVRLPVLPAPNPAPAPARLGIAVQRLDVAPVAARGVSQRSQGTPAAGPRASSTSTMEPHAAVSISWPVALVGLWLVGLVWMLSRLALGALRLGALRRRAQKASVPEIPQDHSAGSAPVLLSDEIEGPAACGLLRPVIVLPRRLIETADAHALDMILKHEHAHIRRRDHMTVIFQRLAESALFFHPCVWYASKELSREREIICDQHAVQGGSRTQYVKLLAGMIERGWGRPSAQAMALFEGSLLTRVRTLLEGRHEGAPELSRRARAVSAIAAAVVVLALGTLRLEARSTQAPGTNASAAAAQSAQTAMQRAADAIKQYRAQSGQFPRSLDELPDELTADPYSASGQPFQYEPSRTFFVLSSAGPDGRYGNDDDPVLFFTLQSGPHSGTRAEIYPLPDIDPDAQVEVQIPGVERPRGTSSISGRVVSAGSDEPIGSAIVYLYFRSAGRPLYVHVAADGSYRFNDIPAGMYSMKTVQAAGYQDAEYTHNGRPFFRLAERQHLSDVTFQLKPALSLSGRIEGDAVDTLDVFAVGQEPDSSGTLMTLGRARPRADGSYRIEALNGQPAYVMVVDWERTPADGGYCPQYYPGTYSREEAELVTFGSGDSRADVNLTLRRTPGLVLEGTVRDQSGSPVAGAYIVAHESLSSVGLVRAYTDASGHYRLSCLGKGEYLVHVDAGQHNLVRKRSTVDVEDESSATRLDFVLSRGVEIAGRMVDEQGNPWKAEREFGRATVAGFPEDSPFSITEFGNKNLPKSVREHAATGFSLGDGNYGWSDMIFPTGSTFLLEGVAAGQTTLEFVPRRPGFSVKHILYNGADIERTGILTTPGQKLSGVVIVVGADS